MILLFGLLLFPLLAALAVFFMRTQKGYGVTVRTASVGIIFLAVIFCAINFNSPIELDLSEHHWIKYAVAALELLIALYIIIEGIKNRSFLIAGFSAVQISAMLIYEFGSEHNSERAIKSLYIDKLSLLMILIISVIGSLICIYAIEYMKDYHRHHPEIKNSRNKFFSLLFIFISAMFGIVVSNNMTIMLLFWEVTTLCSYLLIRYTNTDQSVKNAVLALTINAGGGLSFSTGIILLGMKYGISDFESLISSFTSAGEKDSAIYLAVFLIAVGGLTKSAQMPFSKWLLGAMVAPTPTSAMLHSSTMVKAGVYLIIRLAPLLGENPAGVAVTLIGGITFIVAAAAAVSQSDAKKILAYSTISNLGLIVACTAIGTAESLWAAIMLIIFHAIAKSLLFLSVGSAEHQLGSRNVEDMDGLIRISTTLTMLFVIGIAGMFVAPFGMLISKWAAMKAFIDSDNILILLIVAFGSSITLFFWTKWLGKLIANVNRTDPTGYIMRNDEKIALYSLAAMVVAVCAAHPVISKLFVIDYINSNMHINFISPIDPVDTTIIILMMLVLFILPVILVPLYRSHSVKKTSVYLSGQNAGDNESFYGSMGEVKRLELRNWYMTDIFGEATWNKYGLVISIAVLIAGFAVLAGGLIV